MICKCDGRLIVSSALLLPGILLFGWTAIGIFQANTDLYSHIPAIYLIIGYVLFTERKRIFNELAYSPSCGLCLVFLSAMVYVYGLTHQASFSTNDYGSIISLSSAIYLAGIFLLCFGTKALQQAQFAVFLLVFTIPIPDYLLEHVIVFLQTQSYNAACWVLDTLRMYPIKEGFSIILPDVSVEVAKQCSGIRSSIALLIISVLYGRYFLKTIPSRVLLVILTLFIAPYKNGMRIATLVLLSIYWDKKVLAGALHSAGGIPFFVVGLVWLSLVLFVLARAEKWVLGRFGRTGGEQVEGEEKSPGLPLRPNGDHAEQVAVNTLDSGVRRNDE